MQRIGGTLSASLAGAAALVLGAPQVLAQDASLQALEREVQAMRRQYDATMEQMRRDYEARLRDLERRLKGAEATANSASAQASEAQRVATQAPAASEPAAPPPPPSPAAAASAFNPAIGVVLDGRFTSFSRDPATYRIPGFALGEEATPGDRGFVLGESEINFSANVDQYLYGNLTIAVENDGHVHVEEAYLQSLSLPWGFTVKAGRFFSGIGYLNEQHAHVWDFYDPPLPYRAFLANQYGDDGLQVRWLAPTPFFLELGGEAMRGGAFPAGGDANRGVGAMSAFAHAGADIGTESSFRVGVSHLWTRAKDRTTNDDADVFSGRNDITIFDGVFKWAPDGNPTERNFKLQGEYFLGSNRGTFNGADFNQDQKGWYLQAVYQFAPGWRVGVRHDEVSSSALDPTFFAGTALDNMGVSPSRNSGMVEYNTSEFGRFRVQYNHDESRPETDHQLILQYTISLGAHGAHLF